MGIPSESKSETTQSLDAQAPVPVIAEEDGEYVLRYTVGEHVYTVSGGTPKVCLRELGLAAANWPFRPGNTVDDVIERGLLNRATGSNITMDPATITSGTTRITLTERLEGAEDDGRMTELTIVVAEDGDGGEPLLTNKFVIKWDDLNGDIGSVVDDYQDAWRNLGTEAEPDYRWPSYMSDQIKLVGGLRAVGPKHPHYNAGDILSTRWMLDAESLMAFHWLTGRSDLIERMVQMVERSNDALDTNRFEGVSADDAPTVVEGGVAVSFRYTKAPQDMMFDDDRRLSIGGDGFEFANNWSNLNDGKAEVVPLTTGRILTWRMRLALYVLAFDPDATDALAGIAAWQERIREAIANTPEIIATLEYKWMPKEKFWANEVSYDAEPLRYGYRQTRAAYQDGNDHQNPTRTRDGKTENVSYLYGSVHPTNQFTAMAHAMALWEHYVGEPVLTGRRREGDDVKPNETYGDRVAAIGRFYNEALDHSARTSTGAVIAGRPTLWYQANLGGTNIPQDSNHLGVYETLDYAGIHALANADAADEVPGARELLDAWPIATMKTVLDEGARVFPVPDGYTPRVFYYADRRYFMKNGAIDKPNLFELAQDHLFLMTCGRSSPAFAQMIHDAWHAQLTHDNAERVSKVPPQVPVDPKSMNDRYNVVLHAALHMWNDRLATDDGSHLFDPSGHAGTRSTRGLGRNDAPDASGAVVAFDFAVRTDGMATDASANGQDGELLDGAIYNPGGGVRLPSDQPDARIRVPFFDGLNGGIVADSSSRVLHMFLDVRFASFADEANQMIVSREKRNGVAPTDEDRLWQYRLNDEKGSFFTFDTGGRGTFTKPIFMEDTWYTIELIIDGSKIIQRAAGEEDDYDATLKAGVAALLLGSVEQRNDFYSDNKGIDFNAVSIWPRVLSDSEAAGERQRLVALRDRWTA